MRYPIAGFSSMVLTRDGSRLFVYNTRVDNEPGTFPYWLSVLDAYTLRQLRGHISLAGCGGAELVAVPRQIAVLCYADGGISESLRFVDIRRLQVVAGIPVRGVGLVASPDGKYVYVGGLSITQIDAARHRIVRSHIYPPEEPWTGGVSFDHSVAITDDGKQLVIGVLAVRTDTSSAYALRVFSLPSLRPLRTEPLPQLVHFVAGPGGTLILFPMPDSPGRNWQVDLLSSGLDQSRRLFTVAGPVLQLVLAGPALVTDSLPSS
jgi:DNA-binding beta-propeller fold protein YncE